MLICAYDSAAKIIATSPMMYTSGTIPDAALNTTPKIAHGAIGTMNTSP